MRTIALWYVPNREEPNTKSNNAIDIHVNFWKLKKKHKFRSSDYLIDFGLKVSEVSKIKQLRIYFPFKVNRADIKDLGSILKSDSKYVNAVFNENYELRGVVDEAKFKVVQDKHQEDQFAIYAIDFSPGSRAVAIDEAFNGTVLTLNMDQIYSEKVIETYYFRFRLVGEIFKEFTHSYDPKNWFFQSAFTSTDAVDFRINEKRNFEDDLSREISRNKMFRVNKIHFLLMRTAQDDVIADHLKITCRELEPHLWSTYVGAEYKVDNVVAYHWFQEAGSADAHGIESFNTWVKIKFNKSNWGTIISYLLIALLLAVGFNLLSNVIQKCIDSASHSTLPNTVSGNVAPVTGSMSPTAHQP